MGVAIDQPDRGRIDEVEVARDQFTKRLLGPVPDKTVEQLLGLSHYRFTIKKPPNGKSRPKRSIFLIGTVSFRIIGCGSFLKRHKVQIPVFTHRMAEMLERAR